MIREMKHPNDNIFQDFFEQDKYVGLKNYLYNYLLRKRAIERALNKDKERPELLLEIGTGISPVVTHLSQVIYSDLSFTAIHSLKITQEKGLYIVADGLNLPFKPRAFSHVICSEVIEHIEDDKKTIEEVARVIRPSGHLLITFPHRKFYCANDDRFVKHFRRYELDEISEKLDGAGFYPISIHKVLGPLEKLTMCFVVFCFRIIDNFEYLKGKPTKNFKVINLLIPFFKWANRLYMGLIWLDAMIMPRAFSTVLLIVSVLKDKKK